MYGRGGGGPWAIACRDLTLPRGHALRSVLIRRCLIFCSCLSVMAALTKGLPVTLIPEELLVSSVWDDMVNNGRSCKDASLHTFYAEHVLWLLQESCSHLPPSTIVSTARSTLPVTYMQSLMLRTVFLSIRNQLRTPWFFTGYRSTSWHSTHSSLMYPGTVKG